jgi:hypothetical protein
MDLFTSPLEDEEMSLRELAMPSMEDIEMKKIRFDTCYNPLQSEAKNHQLSGNKPLYRIRE